MLPEDNNLCENTFKSLTAIQWANRAEDIEAELNLYKYMAKV